MANQVERFLRIGSRMLCRLLAKAQDLAETTVRGAENHAQVRVLERLARESMTHVWGQCPAALSLVHNTVCLQQRSAALVIDHGQAVPAALACASLCSKSCAILHLYFSERKHSTASAASQNVCARSGTGPAGLRGARRRAHSARRCTRRSRTTASAAATVRRAVRQHAVWLTR